jgi:hypothetical protein
VGQEVASQTHWPARQRVPKRHEVPEEPHWQLPLAEQPSLIWGLQLTQMTPALPQRLSAGA